MWSCGFCGRKISYVADKSLDPEEARRRTLMRQIAEDGRKLSALIDEQGAALEVIKGKLVQGTAPWREGTCQRCGTETLVVGPVVQPLCVYCDQLRIMPPLPPAQRQEKTLVKPALSPIQARRRDRRVVGLFVLMGTILLAIPAEIAQTMAACLFGLAFLYGIATW